MIIQRITLDEAELTEIKDLCKDLRNTDRTLEAVLEEMIFTIDDALMEAFVLGVDVGMISDVNMYKD